MPGRYAFTFDAASCTGCKACQVACKDKNGLPAGVLWRRVYEVTGGEWQARGEAWTNTVFAYNLSIACNHCENPACAAACPAGAYHVRDDGIVVQEPDECVGCEYCVWVCPYGAPQYSQARGRTTKCDFCRDLLDEGLSPACVAACPMRALDVVRVDSAVRDAPMPFPLPAGVATRPQIAIAAHRAMSSPWSKAVANREEVRLRRPRIVAGLPVSELPLVGFTLLGQAAAGMALVALMLSVESEHVRIAIGGLLAVAGLLSLLHLGRPHGAWRAAANVVHSSLAREILAFAAFAGAWLLAPLFDPLAARVLLAAAGVALVASMTQVYRIDTVERWNSWRTAAEFGLAALALGTVGTVLAGRPASALPWVAALALLGTFGWARSRFYVSVHHKAM